MISHIVHIFASQLQQPQQQSAVSRQWHDEISVCFPKANEPTSSIIEKLLKWANVDVKALEVSTGYHQILLLPWLIRLEDVFWRFNN